MSQCNVILVEFESIYEAITYAEIYYVVHAYRHIRCGLSIRITYK